MSGRGPTPAWTIQEGSWEESKSSAMRRNSPGKPGWEEGSKEKGTRYKALSRYLEKTCKQVNAATGWSVMGQGLGWAAKVGRGLILQG